MQKSFTLDGPASLAQCLDWLKQNAFPAHLRHQPLRVRIADEDLPRSDESNARYWAFTLRRISEQAAGPDGKRHAPRVWHELMREEFAPRVDRSQGLSEPMSTSDMLQSTFDQYVMDVETYAATHLHVSFED